MSNRITRRTFLGTAAPAVLGAGLLASRTWAADAPKTGANGKISLGLIGCGGRGQYLMERFSNIPGTQFVAVCDVNSKRAAEAQKKAGGKAETYGDFRKLLENKAVDAVIVATPGHWHVLPTIEACAAGKDVYCEKPLGTSIGEGRAAVNATKKYNRIVQLGCQQHSWEHYIQAVEIIRSGVLGDISSVQVWDFENFSPGYGAPPDSDAPPEIDWEFFVGPSPKVPYNQNRYDHHYWFYDYGGGWELDWAVHHYDIVQWAMGVSAPLSAFAMGGKFAFPKDNTQWPDVLDAACQYPAGPVSKNGFQMNYTFRSGNNEPIKGRIHGKEFYGTNGTLVLNRKGFEIYSQTRDGKKVIEDKTGASYDEHTAVEVHAKNFLDCVQSRKTPNASIEIGHLSSNPGHLMNISYRTGRMVKWDAENEQVIDDPKANELISRLYRKPWVLPA